MPDFNRDSTSQWGTGKVSLSLHQTFGTDPKSKGN